MHEEQEMLWRIALLATAVGIAGTSCLIPLKSGWRLPTLATHLGVIVSGVLGGGIAAGLLGSAIANRSYRGEFMGGVAVAFVAFCAALLGGFGGGVAAVMVVRRDRARPLLSWPSLGMALVSYLVSFQLASSLGLFDVLEDGRGFRGKLAAAGLLVALLLAACVMLAGEALADPAAGERPTPPMRPASPPARGRPGTPAETAAAAATGRSSRLRGFRLFAAWLLAGIPAFAGSTTRITGLPLPGLTVSILAQGWVLQRSLGSPVFVPWSVVTLVGGGWVLPWLVAALADEVGTMVSGTVAPPGTGLALTSVVLVSVAFGTGLGLAQWAVLRRALPHAWVWIPSVALTGVLSSLLALGTTEPPEWLLQTPARAVLYVTFAGFPFKLLYPIATGVALVLLQGRQFDARRLVPPLRSSSPRREP